MSKYKVYDARTGEEEDAKHYNITLSNEDNVAITFQTGFVLALHKDMRMVVHEDSRINSPHKLNIHKKNIIPVSNITGGWVERMEPLTIYNGMDIEQRLEMLGKKNFRRGNTNGWQQLENIISSLGGLTHYSKGYRKNEHGRWLKNEEMVDVLEWDYSPHRKIIDVNTTEEGWKIERLEGEEKEIVIVGITLVPIYV